MAGGSLDLAASLSCPHGGSVVLSASNTQSGAGGVPMLMVTDTLTIAGCPFTLPGPKPSPCVVVRWIVADTRVSYGGIPGLSQSAVGVCYSAENIPQGSVIVISTQPRATST